MYLYSYLRRFKTRHDFQALLCYESDYLISCFYCIVQFRLKKNIRKERGREKRFKTRHDFEAFLCYESYYLISCFYCIIPIWVQKEYKERKKTFQRACERRRKIHKNKQKTQTNNNNKHNIILLVK